MESHKHGTKSPTNARDPPNMVGMDIVWEGQRTRSICQSQSWVREEFGSLQVQEESRVVIPTVAALIPDSGAHAGPG